MDHLKIRKLLAISSLQGPSDDNYPTNFMYAHINTLSYAITYRVNPFILHSTNINSVLPVIQSWGLVAYHLLLHGSAPLTFGLTKRPLSFVHKDCLERLVSSRKKGSLNWVIDLTGRC